jgi:hypothetical protein
VFRLLFHDVSCRLLSTDYFPLHLLFLSTTVIWFNCMLRRKEAEWWQQDDRDLGRERQSVFWQLGEPCSSSNNVGMGVCALRDFQKVSTVQSVADAKLRWK